MRKERNKLKPSDLEKIDKRFAMKFEEFDKLPLYDEMDGETVKLRGLRSIFREDRMSSTDKKALVAVVDKRLEIQRQQIMQQMETEAKEAEQQKAEPSPFIEEEVKAGNGE